MKTSIAATIVALALAGCSSLPLLSPKEDPIVTELKGKNLTFLQSKLGLPNARQETPSGAMVWVYRDTQKGMSAKRCEVSLSIRDSVVESVVIKSDNSSMLSMFATPCKDIRKALDLTN